MLKCGGLSGEEVCTDCRSRHARFYFLNQFFKLDPNQNEYFFAKIGVDTDDNKPLKVWR